MKTGTSYSGQLITGVSYLKQRFKDAIETIRGSLVGARDFGSDFYMLQDRNIDPKFYMQAYIYLAEAINNPGNGLDDFKLEDMTVEILSDRHFEITVSGIHLYNNEPVTLDNVVIRI